MRVEVGKVAVIVRVSVGVRDNVGSFVSVLVKMNVGVGGVIVPVGVCVAVPVMVAVSVNVGVVVSVPVASKGVSSMEAETGAGEASPSVAG